MFALLCWFGWSGTAQAAPLDQPAVDRWITAADRLAREVQALAADEQFAGWLAVDADLVACIGRIGSAAYDSLRKVSIVEVPRSALVVGLAEQADPGMDSAALCRFVSVMSPRTNPFLVVSMVNGQQGPLHLAASSLLTGTCTYLQPQDWREDLLLVLDYGAEYAVAVAFWQSGEHTVTGHAAFIRSEETQGLLDWVDRLCGESMPVKVLTGQELKQEAL